MSEDYQLLSFQLAHIVTITYLISWHHEAQGIVAAVIERPELDCERNYLKLFTVVVTIVP